MILQYNTLQNIFKPSILPKMTLSPGLVLSHYIFTSIISASEYGFPYIEIEVLHFGSQGIMFKGTGTYLWNIPKCCFRKCPNIGLMKTVSQRGMSDDEHDNDHDDCDYDCDDYDSDDDDDDDDDDYDDGGDDDDDDGGGGGEDDDGADIKGWTTQIPTLHSTNELFEHVWSHLNLRICFRTKAIYTKERKHHHMCDIRLLSVKVDYTTQMLNKVKPLQYLVMGYHSQEIRREFGHHAWFIPFNSLRALRRQMERTSWCPLNLSPRHIWVWLKRGVPCLITQLVMFGAFCECFYKNFWGQAFLHSQPRYSYVRMTIQYLGLGTAAVCPDTTHVGRKGMKSCQSNEQIIYLEAVGLKIEQHDSNLLWQCQHNIHWSMFIHTRMWFPQGEATIVTDIGQIHHRRIPWWLWTCGVATCIHHQYLHKLQHLIHLNFLNKKDFSHQIIIQVDQALWFQNLADEFNRKAISWRSKVSSMEQHEMWGIRSQVTLVGSMQ